MRILLDCDGVLADFLGTVLNAAESHATFHKLGLRPFPRSEDIPGWNLREHVDAAQHRLIMDILDSKIAAFSGDRNIAAIMRPMAGAQRAVAAMQATASRGVFVVTSPWVDNAAWEFMRRAWLKRFFNIDEDQIVSTTAKFLVDGDVLVDDRPKHVRQWQEARGKKAVLFEHAHNAKERAVAQHSISGWTDDAIRLIYDVARENKR